MDISIKFAEISVEAVELAEECGDEGVVCADWNKAGIVHFSELFGDTGTDIDTSGFDAMVICGYYCFMFFCL